MHQMIFISWVPSLILRYKFETKLPCLLVEDLLENIRGFSFWLYCSQALRSFCYLLFSHSLMNHTHSQVGGSKDMRKRSSGGDPVHLWSIRKIIIYIIHRISKRFQNPTQTGNSLTIYFYPSVPSKIGNTLNVSFSIHSRNKKRDENYSIKQIDSDYSTWKANYQLLGARMFQKQASSTMKWKQSFNNWFGMTRMELTISTTRLISSSQFEQISVQFPVSLFIENFFND